MSETKNTTQNGQGKPSVKPSNGNPFGTRTETRSGNPFGTRVETSTKK